MNPANLYLEDRGSFGRTPTDYDLNLSLGYNMSLGPVVSVSEQHPAPALPMFTAPSAGRATPSPVPVSAGSQQVSVTVTAVFALG